MWVGRPRLAHTQPRRDRCSQEGRTTIGTCCVPGPRHRDGVDMPDAGLHPHREAMHKQHTEPGPSCCVPFRRPTCPQRNTIGRNQAGCSHSSANTLGQSTIWRGPTRPTTSPKEGKEGGTSAKGSVLMLTCVPLPNQQRKFCDGPVRVKGITIGAQQRKHIGTNPSCGEETPDRRQVQIKEKEGGASAKGSVLILTCVPLPHIVLPLSGCACSGTPTMATRGEARGHP